MPTASDEPAAAPPTTTRRLSPVVAALVLLVPLALLAGLIALSAGGSSILGKRGRDDAAAAQTRAAATTTGGTAPAASATDTLPRASVNRFDGGAAYRLTAKQVGYGQRPAGSPQLAKLAEVLRPLLPAGHFERLPGSTAAKPLRNIVGTIAGKKPAIVIGAHYDTLVKPEGFVGANNGASGSALVIGIANAMRKLKRPADAPELKFVLFDGEEPDAGLPEEQSDFYHSGLRGSRAYTARHRGQTRSMLLLDYVGNKDLTLPMEASSDRSLWTQVRRAATQVGVGSIFPDRVDVSIQDDHTPFQVQGVPAVDFIDWSYPGHTLQDGMALISRRALDAVGETVVQHLRNVR